jgi:hypothetical protein
MWYRTVHILVSHSFPTAARFTRPLLLLHSNSRIRPLACSGFYELHLLRGLPGSLLPLGLYQIACFGTRPSSILSTCSSQSCLYLIILSLTENTPNSFLISAIEVRSPTGADFSSSPCVQTGSGAHPASYPMSTGGSFPRPRRDADHSPPSSAEIKNE